MEHKQTNLNVSASLKFWLEKSSYLMGYYSVFLYNLHHMTENYKIRDDS